MTEKLQLRQSDVPAMGLREALRIAETLRDQYAKQPTKPLDVAKALELGPQGSQFKMLTGASNAYGLTEGAAKAEAISLTELGRRAVAPTVEGDDVQAMREALMTPRVIGEFLTKYDDHPLPKPEIARNVLEEMGVPPKALVRAHELIVTEAEALGLLVEIKGTRYVSHSSKAAVPTADNTVVEDASAPAGYGHATVETLAEVRSEEEETYDEDEATPVQPVAKALPETDRVFVTHGSNKDIVEQIKKILRYGKLEPVVSAQKETTAKPVPDKVMDDMRSCGAGIVHIGVEKVLRDEDDNEVRMLNPNVLIEIGAAMALYEHRFVLLVERGISLPSNLQGLYEVRYEGNTLDYDATMKLLEAFNDFHPKSDG
jgi:predicted nucleotide-binding protein